MSVFEWPVRVYYEDTDSGGVVYHANYLHFMERARTEWLRALGFEQDVLRDQQNVLFAVHKMTLGFQRPARFNDALLIKSRLEKASGASMQFEQLIYRGEELLCDATVSIACLDAETFRPKPIPKSIVTEMHSER